MTSADRVRMEKIIDRMLDGDCGRGIGEIVSHEIVANATIGTLEELDALPVGTIVRHHSDERTWYRDGSWEQGAVAEKRIDASDIETWFFVGRSLGYRSHQADLLPALVVYLGGEA